MLAKSSDRPLSPLRIKQEGNFYARLLSKESSLSATPSFRVYYGVSSGSVPFVWESQPGTPKATVAAAGLPPLTPPPSHFHHPRKIMATKKKRRRASRFSVLATLFRRIILRKPCMPRSPLPFSPVSSLTSSPFTRLSSSNSLQRSSFSSGGTTTTTTTTRMADQRDPCFAFRYSGSHASAYSVDAVITRKNWSGSTEKDLLKECFPGKLLSSSALRHSTYLTGW